jgi:hypothetical protein
MNRLVQQHVGAPESEWVRDRQDPAWRVKEEYYCLHFSYLLEPYA